MSQRPKTKSSRRALRFWGWGYEDENLSPSEDTFIEAAVERLVPEGAVEVPPPVIEDIKLPPSKLSIPENLRDIISITKYDRLVHSFGKSFPDIVRMYLRKIPNAPDGVAFPHSENDIMNIFSFAEGNNIAIIPFGGGTSVCGGVEPAVGDEYAATLSVDMEYFDQVHSIDTVSRRVKIGGGAFGPDIETKLKPHGLTLRHFPQSFPFSTLGGWIATRAGGHFATGYTHIDDMVEAIRMVTPAGVIETRDVPGSGAGPSADRLFLGSEGTMGIITEATMRLQARPTWRASASLLFDTAMQGAEAVRQISQSGLSPSNCRLLDNAEVGVNNVVQENKSVLIIGFESANHDVEPWLSLAMKIAQNCGGEISPKEKVEKQQTQTWRNAFIRMPYWRNRFVAFGIIADTFETAVTWDRFPDFYTEITSAMTKAIEDITCHPCLFSCRITHVYPDGPAPYFTFYAVGDTKGDLAKVLEKWRKIKALANRLVVELGGTITHHHAVGRDHRSGYEQQTSELFRQTLAAAKSSLDPSGILNPGVLIDPVGRDVGITGSMNPKNNSF